jgi:hypothetical protein
MNLSWWEHSSVHSDKTGTNAESCFKAHSLEKQSRTPLPNLAHFPLLLLWRTFIVWAWILLASHGCAWFIENREDSFFEACYLIFEHSLGKKTNKVLKSICITRRQISLNLLFLIFHFLLLHHYFLAITGLGYLLRQMSCEGENSWRV